MSDTVARAFGLQAPHQHRGPAISIAGHGTPQWKRARTGHVGGAWLVCPWRGFVSDFTHHRARVAALKRHGAVDAVVGEAGRDLAAAVAWLGACDCWLPAR